MIPVAIYIPNLLGYARIILAFYGLHLSSTQPVLAIAVWVLSAALDLLDGIAARHLHQTSQLGVILDICADNILRSCVWMGAAQVEAVLPMVACGLTSIEWFTALCSQLHGAAGSSHWKDERQKDPWLVRNCFANNFRTPLGVWVIYGLFFSGVLSYGSVHVEVYDRIPYFNVLLYLSYAGRCLAFAVELWLCRGYLSMVISNDSKARDGTNAKHE